MTLVKCFSLECPTMVHHTSNHSLDSLDMCLFLVGLRHSVQFFSYALIYIILFTFILDKPHNEKRHSNPSTTTYRHELLLIQIIIIARSSKSSGFFSIYGIAIVVRDSIMCFVPWLSGMALQNENFRNPERLE